MKGIPGIFGKSGNVLFLSLFREGQGNLMALTRRIQALECLTNFYS